MSIVNVFVFYYLLIFLIWNRYWWVKCPLADDLIVFYLCAKNKVSMRGEEKKGAILWEKEKQNGVELQEWTQREARKRKPTNAEQRPPEPTIVSRLIHLMHCRAVINFLCDSQLRLNTSDEKKISLTQKYDRQLEFILRNPLNIYIYVCVDKNYAQTMIKDSAPQTNLS